MVKQNKKQKRHHISTKNTKSRSKILSKKITRVTGRPLRSISEPIHEKYYAEIKEINETIAFLIKKFSASNDYIQCEPAIFLQNNLPCLLSKQFEEKILSQQQRKIYGSKSTLLYWLHYAVMQIQKKVWYPQELLNLILGWFCSQNTLTKETYIFGRSQSFFSQFSINLFDEKEVRNLDDLNLLVILAVDIACFQDICIIQERVIDVVDKFEQMMTTMETQDYRILMS